MVALYSEVLLDHFRHPRNYGSLPEPDVTFEEFNPICGDRIRIELKIEDGLVEAARFKGDGCAISMAAASLLTELMIASEIKQLETITEERVIELLQSDIKPSRRQCAVLPLIAVKSGLREYAQKRSAAD
jgi:nitrogen fixation NifU-like protein